MTTNIFTHDIYLWTLKHCWHQDLFRDLERKREEQMKMQQEIDIINQEHQKQKEVRSEQERLAEQKVIEYMKQKAVSMTQYQLLILVQLYFDTTDICCLCNLVCCETLVAVYTFMPSISFKHVSD